MKLTIRRAVESDAPALAAINIAAFQGPNSFLANAFPGLSYDAVHQVKTARFLQKLSVPGMSVLAAVDDSGVVVGAARWRFPPEPGAKRKGGGEQMLPPGTNKKVYDGFFESIKQRGKTYLRDDDIGMPCTRTCTCTCTCGYLYYYLLLLR